MVVTVFIMLPFKSGGWGDLNVSACCLRLKGFIDVDVCWQKSALETVVL